MHSIIEQQIAERVLLERRLDAFEHSMQRELNQSLIAVETANQQMTATVEKQSDAIRALSDTTNRLHMDVQNVADQQKKTESVAMNVHTLETRMSILSGDLDSQHQQTGQLRSEVTMLRTRADERAIKDMAVMEDLERLKKVCVCVCVCVFVY